MKNVLMTSCVGYKWDKIKNIVISFRKVNKVDDLIVIFHDKPDAITLRNLEKWNAIPVQHQVSNPDRITVNRFLSYSAVLRSNPGTWKYACLFDANDIFLQKNPFEYIDANIGDYGLIASSESIKYCDEVWGNQNLRETFPYAYEHLKENLVYNCGTLCGKADSILALSDLIFACAVHSSVHIACQASYNYIVQSGMKHCTKFTDMSHGWAVQCGTVENTERMHRPDSMFAEKIVEKPPILKDGLICNSEDLPFYVVHQYQHSYNFREHIADLIKKWETE